MYTNCSGVIITECILINVLPPKKQRLDNGTLYEGGMQATIADLLLLKRRIP